MVRHRQSPLFEVVATLHSASRFARRLHGGQKQSDQNVERWRGGEGDQFQSYSRYWRNWRAPHRSGLIFVAQAPSHVRVEDEL